MPNIYLNVRDKINRYTKNLIWIYTKELPETWKVQEMNIFVTMLIKNIQVINKNEIRKYFE